MVLLSSVSLLSLNYQISSLVVAISSLKPLDTGRHVFTTPSTFCGRCYTETINWHYLAAHPPPQRSGVTPSVSRALFVWCCLTSAWEESTLPHLGQDVQRFLEELSWSVQKVATSQRDVIGSLRWRGKKMGRRGGPWVLRQRISLDPRCDRRDRDGTIFRAWRSRGVRLSKSCRQDQVLSFGTRAMETVIPALTLY